MVTLKGKRRINPKRKLSSEEEESLSLARVKLKEMVGLKPVKAALENFLALQWLFDLREQEGLKNPCCSRHMVFLGNPGTAKTTVAKLLTAILKEEGLVTTGSFIECDRADIIGEYVGQTAPKVAELFQKAEGGVLFIDEAYSLQSEDDFSAEAISSIVKAMEDYRDQVICIFAGYPKEMEQLLKTNAGLKSRIGYKLEFPDYSAQELLQIFHKLATDYGITLEAGIDEALLELLEQAMQQSNFGNGRFVRNVFERSLAKMALRLKQAQGQKLDQGIKLAQGQKAGRGINTAQSSEMEEGFAPSKQELSQLKVCDLAIELIGNLTEAKEPRTIGFF